MGRQVRDYRLGSPEARSKLARRHNPYWREIIPGLHIGYRKGDRGGVWIGRKYIDDGKYSKWRLGLADDIVDADGTEVLSFTQADAKARLGPSGKGGKKMQTVNDALTYYMKHQEAVSRSHETTQYSIDKHIEPTLGQKRLSRLTIENITDWRNDLAKARKPKQSSDISSREHRRRRHRNIHWPH